MKKLFAILLVAMMVLSLVACVKEPVVETSYKTGLGLVASVSVADYNKEEEKDGKAQTDATACEVTLDKDGKIVAIAFDAVQGKPAVHADGKIEAPEKTVSKKTLKDDYNMKKFEPEAVGEWYEQVGALEDWCIGKTVDEVVNMELGLNAKGHDNTPADADLMTKCTITVTDFIKALKMAADNAGHESEAFAKAGLGLVANVAVADANKEEEKDGKAQTDATACAVRLDADGKIVAISFDAIQGKPVVTIESKVTAPEKTDSKKTLKDDYNMKKFEPEAVGEWYEQVGALEDWCIGKTVDEVVNMELGLNAKGHDNTPADADLMTKCTITVTDFIEALRMAAETAK